MSIGPMGLNYLPLFAKISKTRIPAKLRNLLTSPGQTLDDVYNAQIFIAADLPFGSIHYFQQNFLVKRFGQMVEVDVAGFGTQNESLEMDFKPKKDGGPFILIETD